MNMYDYVGGDPVNKTDPTGQVADIIVIGKLAPIIAPKVVAAAVGVVTGVAKLLGSIFGGGKTKSPKPSNNSNNTTQQEQPQMTQQLSPCQQSYIAGQLNSRGLPSGHLGSVRFVSGLDASAGDFLRSALNGGANFRGAGGYEEVVHTAQFALNGGAAFYQSYGLNSIMGAISGLGAYKGNAYEAFAKGAANVMAKGAPGCPG